jgi:hypothetical protein
LCGFIVKFRNSTAGCGAIKYVRVCRDFDEMRAYLQESVQQRLKDEKSKEKSHNKKNTVKERRE